MLDQLHFKLMSLSTIFVMFCEDNFEFLFLRSDFD
jgi:hypothetical protein